MLNAQFRPLDQWPGKRTEQRKSAPFRSTYKQTLDLLEFELQKLRAHQTVIQIEDPEPIKLIRNDGQLWGTGKMFTPNRPGVVLSFKSPKGAISIPCDRYDNWSDNLRAIALSLEALRAVDRYGVTRGNEQYRGWARLEAPASGKMTREQAIEFIAQVVGANVYVLGANWSTLGEAMIKRAKMIAYPDHAVTEAVKIEKHEIFVKIGQAEEVLCHQENEQE